MNVDQNDEISEEDLFEYVPDEYSLITINEKNEEIKKPIRFSELVQMNTSFDDSYDDYQFHFYRPNFMNDEDFLKTDLFPIIGTNIIKLKENDHFILFHFLGNLRIVNFKVNYNKFNIFFLN